MNGDDKFVSDLSDDIENYVPETNKTVEKYFGSIDNKVRIQLQTAEGRNNKEGGFGTVSIIDLSVLDASPAPFYVKKIHKDNIIINERNKKTILDKIYNEIKSIYKEISINIDVTKKIPDCVSKCKGGYIYYNIENKYISYVAYIVFEYLPGFSLADYLFRYRKNKPIPNSEQIITNIDHCIKALHSIDYVHRDIKPENIFIVSNNKISDDAIIIEKCILIDFGESFRIGEKLNINFENIKGNDRYNPFLKEDPGKLTWVRGITPVSTSENIKALTYMKEEPLQYGFKRGGKTYKKRKTRRFRKQ